MADKDLKLAFDHQIDSAMLDVIQQANEYLYIVTPYIKMWDYVKVELRSTKKKGVRVRVILRDEKKARNAEDEAWFTESGIPMAFVHRLHAKIFLNEHMAVIGSMNLHEDSAQNSREIAMIISEPAFHQEIRSYIEKRLLPVDGLHAGRATEHYPVDKARPRRPSAPRSNGACIRCGDAIDLNPEKPLCDEHYKKWAKYKDPDYPEKFCHSCGKSAEVTYANPLCFLCNLKFGVKDLFG